MRKSEQDLIQRIEHVETRWIVVGYDARQGILASDNHRIFRAQPTQPGWLEFDADNPAEKCPAFLSMTEVRFLHDHSVPVSGALSGLRKAEDDFPERRGKRQAVCGQQPAIPEDVDRIYKVAVALQRRELRVEGGLREQVFAVFDYPNGPVRQCFDPWW